MIFLMCSFGVEALANGQMKTMVLTKDVKLTFSLPVTNRDTLRWWFETVDATTLEICAKETSDCKVTTTNTSTGSTHFEKADGDLVKSGTVYFTLLSATAQSVNLTAHAAIEMQNGAAFVQDDKAVQFYTLQRTFAYFIGTPVDVAITLSAEVPESEAKLITFNGEDEMAPRIQKFTNTTTLTTAFISDEIGYVYVTISAPSYQIVISQKTPEVTLNQPRLPINVSLLAEGSACFTVKYDKAQFKEADKLVLSAFAGNTAFFGVPWVHSSSVGYPMGLRYNPDGTVYELEFQHPFTKGILEASTNVTVSDQLYLRGGFQNKYRLSRAGLDYLHYEMFIIAQRNPTVIRNVPGEVQFSLAGDGISSQDFIINEALYNETESGCVSHNDAIGYFFTAETDQSVSVDIRGVINNDDIPGKKKISLTKQEHLVQALITYDQYIYISQEGMYYANIQSKQSVTNANFRVGVSYNLDREYTQRIVMLPPNRTLTFYANVEALGRDDYMVCLEFQDADQMDPEAFTVYASNRNVYPNPKNDMTFEYISRHGTLFGKTMRYCVQGLQHKNKYAYFTVLNNGRGPAPNFGLSSMGFGEPYYYLDAVPIDVQSFFSAEQVLELGLRLQPPFYRNEKRSIIERKMYIEINFDGEGLDQDATMYITEPGSGYGIYYEEMKQGTKYFWKEILMPVDKELILELKNEKGAYFAKMSGEVFFTFIYDTEMYGSAYVKSSDSPALFRLNVERFQSPVLYLYSNKGLLPKLKGWICKDQPRLNDDDPYAHDCIDVALNQREHQSIHLPYDAHMTENYRLSIGSYYITLLPISSLDALEAFDFEISHTYPLKMNQNNPIRLLPDPVQASMGLRNESYVVFDVVKDMIEYYDDELFVDFETPVLKICLSYDEPVGYYDFSKNTTRCFFKDYGLQNITATIEDSPDINRRIFINVLCGQQTVSKLRNVYLLGYSVVTPNDRVTFSLSDHMERNGENDYIVKADMTNITEIEVLAGLDMSPEEYEEQYMKGLTDVTLLQVSDGPHFNNPHDDDADGIQVIRWRPKPGQAIVYIKVHMKAAFRTLQCFLQIADQTKILQQELNFLRPMAIPDLKAGKIQDFVFKAYHTPVQLNVEMCKIAKPPTPTGLQVPLPTAIDVMFTPFAVNVNKNTKAKLQQGFGEDFVVDIPSVFDQSDYYNVNFFMGITSEADISFRTTILTGSNKPSTPKNQQVYVIKTPIEFRMKFRSAGLQAARGFDGIANVGFAELKKPGISYRVFAYNNQTLPLNAVLSTECGLEAAAKPVTEWFLQDYVENAQLNLSFIMNDFTPQTMFVLLARNDVMGATKAYTPVGFEFESGNSVDPVGLGLGITFGVIGLGVIVVLAYFIWKMKKPKAVYKALV